MTMMTMMLGITLLLITYLSLTRISSGVLNLGSRVVLNRFSLLSLILMSIYLNHSPQDQLLLPHPLLLK